MGKTSATHKRASEKMRCFCLSLEADVERRHTAPPAGLEDVSIVKTEERDGPWTRALATGCAVAPSWQTSRGLPPANRDVGGCQSWSRPGADRSRCTSEPLLPPLKQEKIKSDTVQCLSCVNRCDTQWLHQRSEKVFFFSNHPYMFARRQCNAQVTSVGQTATW